jgi:hypothetical protein
LASAHDEIAPRIAQNLGCGSQTVRNAIHELSEKGLKSFTSGSSCSKGVHAAFDEEGAEALRELLHRVSAQQTLCQLACSAQEAV